MEQVNRRRLDEFWDRNFQQSLPLAHELRDRYRNRWERFHSLPKSKRYADTADEWTILLQRQNALFNRLAAEGRQLELITTHWSSGEDLANVLPEVRGTSLRPLHWKSFAKDGNQSNWWHLFGVPIKWRTAILDPVLRLVADHEISNVMVVDTTSDWLIHPYDGGVDLILGSAEERDVIASEFSQWRSQRRDGM